MSFMAALGFLTIAPVGKKALDNELLARAVAFFPLVGLILGATLAGADYVLRLGLSDFLASTLVVALLVMLTGALHFEGFVDSCDGLFGGHSPERRLDIMRFKDVGAYAVAGGVLLLLVKVSAIAAITGPSRIWVLGLFPALSRWAMALVLGSFPYARQQGLGSAFRGKGLFCVGIAGFISLTAAVLLGGGGLLLFATATTLAVLMGLGIFRLIGGLTGDTYGAINEVVEASLLVVAVGMLPHLAVLPLWEEGF